MASAPSSRTTSNADLPAMEDVDFSDLDEDEEPPTPGSEDLFANMSVSKEGYLHKKGQKFPRAWQLRYCRLRGETLIYYKTDKEEHPQGVCHLDECEIKDSSARTKKPYSFDVGHSTKRVFEFYAQSEEERRDWIAALQRAIDSCDKTKLAERAQYMKTQLDRLLKRNKRLQKESNMRRVTIQLDELKRTEVEIALQEKDKRLQSLQAENESMQHKLARLQAANPEQPPKSPAATPTPTPTHQRHTSDTVLPKTEDVSTVTLLEAKLHEANGKLGEMTKELEKLRLEKKVLLKEVKRLRSLVEPMPTVPESE